MQAKGHKGIRAGKSEGNRKTKSTKSESRKQINMGGGGGGCSHLGTAERVY